MTTETGIYVISTAAGKVVRVIPDPGGPQGLAVSPSGKTLYVTNPNGDDLWVISAATGRVMDRIAAGAQPYAVAVTPDGGTAYVTDMNSDSVSAISTSTLRTIATVPVGRLPEAVAVTPDGRQVWVGNDLSGNITVINPATNTVTTTISGGSGTATLLAGPLGHRFHQGRVSTRAASWRVAAIRLPASWLAGPGILTTAQQGQEDRIGTVPVRPELGVPAIRLRAAQAGHLGQDGGGVEHLDVVAAAEHVGQHVPGLAAVRRAGDVADHTARADRVQGVAEQAALQPGQAQDVLGRPAPAGLRAAAQGADAGAGDVGQHPVEGPRAPGGCGRIDGCRSRRAGDRHRVAGQPGPVRARVRGQQVRSPLCCEAGQQPGLASRAGA